MSRPPRSHKPRRRTIMRPRRPRRRSLPRRPKRRRLRWPCRN
jgi:hypothetical protein